jgi:hypothetical protein
MCFSNLWHPQFVVSTREAAKNAIQSVCAACVHVVVEKCTFADGNTNHLIELTLIYPFLYSSQHLCHCHFGCFGV